MCRFLLYTGPPLTLDKLITEPVHSLIHQSYESRMRREPLNGDGFGMAWYVPEISPIPGRFRSIRPAWSSANLRDIARVSASSMVLSHVRAASPGLEVSESNCHPFTNGRIAFMHNGSIGGFKNSKREFQRTLTDKAFLGISGSTDSEHAFAHFLDHFDEAHDCEPLERLARCIEATIRLVLEVTRASGSPSDLNFAVSDGSCAVATRFSSGESDQSLFINRGREYRCENGVCRMVEAHSESTAVVVASEPLTEDDGWEEVPSKTMVLIAAGGAVEMRDLKL